MYIAFKWLFCLVVSMWITACCLDVYLKRNKSIVEPDDNNNIAHVEHGFKNVSDSLKKYQFKVCKRKYKYLGKINDYTGIPLLYYLSFSLGITIIFGINNNKINIVVYLKKKLTKATDQPYISQSTEKIKSYIQDWNIMLIPFKFLVKILQFFIKHMVYLHKKYSVLCILPQFTKLNELVAYYSKENKLTVLKLKAAQHERIKLSELLSIALIENRNIQNQFQLQRVTTAKLLDSIENSKRLLKAQLSRYNSLQHVYIVTDRENKCIKRKFAKLSNDKNDIENKLKSLVRQVYLSRNAELRAFCSRWIIRPENSLLFMDVSEEIQRFIRSSTIDTCTSNMIQHGDIRPNYVQEVAENSVILKLEESTEGNEKDRITTVPKSYSCSNYSYGDIMCNNCDGKCCLDYSRARLIHIRSGINTHDINIQNLENSTTDHKFLTNSEAFKMFLRNNRNIFPRIQSSSPNLAITWR